MRDTSSTTIPALQLSEIEWALTPVEKANGLTASFQSKGTLPQIVLNEYSNRLDYGDVHGMEGFLPIRERIVKQVLSKLREDSSTGPDMLSARILKRCAETLCRPITIIAMKI